MPSSVPSLLQKPNRLYASMTISSVIILDTLSCLLLTALGCAVEVTNLHIAVLVTRRRLQEMRRETPLCDLDLIYLLAYICISALCLGRELLRVSLRKFRDFQFHERIRRQSRLLSRPLIKLSFKEWAYLLPLCVMPFVYIFFLIHLCSPYAFLQI
jgi:hypothetical protein